MNIIITGASRGIGYATAISFVKKLKDCKIILISRNLSKLHELKNICEGINSNCDVTPIAIDLHDFPPEKQVLKNIKTIFNKVDILINNAGYLERKKFNEFDENSINKIFAVNFTGPARLIRALLPVFNWPSHVLNMGSMGGYQGSKKFPGLSFYSASKAAIACLTECLAEEYKETGISFNCLAIGAAQTEMLAEAFPGYIAPLTADEMADFITDFAINGNKFFNGKIIPVSLSTP